MTKVNFHVMTAPWFTMLWLVTASASAWASPRPPPPLELSLTESTRHIRGFGDSSVTTIALKKGELTVHEQVRIEPDLAPDQPPDRDLRRTLDADELSKVRALLAASGIIAHGNVDAGAPRCGGKEYHLELQVDIDGKRLRRDIRGMTVISCLKAYSPFLSSRAYASSRHLVDGLKALADPP